MAILNPVALNVESDGMALLGHLLEQLPDVGLLSIGSLPVNHLWIDRNTRPEVIKLDHQPTGSSHLEVLAGDPSKYLDPLPRISSHSFAVALHPQWPAYCFLKWWRLRGWRDSSTVRSCGLRPWNSAWWRLGLLSGSSCWGFRCLSVSPWSCHGVTWAPAADCFSISSSKTQSKAIEQSLGMRTVPACCCPTSMFLKMVKTKGGPMTSTLSSLITNENTTFTFGTCWKV